MKTYPFLKRLSSFTGRAVVFFFILSLLLLFFYLLGNYQAFLDSTQIFLLTLLHAAVTLELVSAAYLLGILAVRCIRERRVLVVRIILVILSMATSSAILVALRFLQSWFQV